MTRLAAIDCGTNSIRLLVSEVQPDGSMKEITRLNEIVRLGQGVDATGRLHPDAIARTRTALANYVEIMNAENVEDVRMVATSATRDASNRDDFFSMTERLLGKPAEVISGRQEAELSMRGAVLDLDPSRGPFCVIDLGGGSTEFIIAEADGTLISEKTTRMGCVRLTERFLKSDPATDEEVVAAEEYVAQIMDEVVAAMPLTQASTFVGVAGTFTTITALALGLERYSRDDIHTTELGFDALRVITGDLVDLTAMERETHPVIHPGRADVIGGGSIVVDGIIDAIEAHTSARTFVISEKDILDGIVAELAE